MTNDLKPCPFCGGDAMSSQGLSSFEDCEISCIKCDANGGNFDNHGDDAGAYQENYRDALTAWNTREPDHDSVIIPVHADEAAMMVLLGTEWLEKNAPHRLKKAGQPDDSAELWKKHKEKYVTIISHYEFEEILKLASPNVRELRWRSTFEQYPAEGSIVLVAGGTAQWREGKWYSGMEHPYFQRPIQWEVKRWLPLHEIEDRKAK